MMHIECCPYQRHLRQPLHTAHGVWSVRTGVLLRLTAADGTVGFGEIAPLPWFGSETLEQALMFCTQLGGEVTIADIHSIPASLPACQFGFESAWEMLPNPPKSPFKRETLNRLRSPLQKGGGGDLPPLGCATSAPLPCQAGQVGITAGLLPTGSAALEAWRSLWTSGYRTFKWKIGMQPIASEIDLLQRLCAQLPIDARLRLDANGGLCWETAEQWLQVCDRLPQIEYLEQPLPPDQFDAMLTLAQQHHTPLALDESVATLEQLIMCHQRGWLGVMVIKPAIVGSPRHLRQFCQAHSLNLVGSSVLETAIGRHAGWQLAVELGNPDRAIGFGASHWFDDGWDQVTPDQFETLWRQIKAQRP